MATCSPKTRMDVSNECSTIKNMLNRDNSNDRRAALQRLHNLLSQCKKPSVSRGGSDMRSGELRVDASHANHTFAQDGYEKMAWHLLKVNSVEWWKSLDEATRHMYDHYFTQGIPHLALTVLISFIQKNSVSFGLSRSVSLLESLVKNDGLLHCLLAEIDSTPVIDSMDNVDVDTSTRWDSLSTAIVSLPLHLANKLQSQNSDAFMPMKYIPRLSHHIITVLSSAYDKLEAGNDINIQFLSRLIARLSFAGYSDMLWPILVTELESRVTTDFLWSRITCRLVASVPETYLESVLVPILSHVSRYTTVEKMVGDIIMEKRKAEYLMCTKIPLLRYFDRVTILQNMIGYMATSPKRHSLFVQLVGRLLDVWSDGSALRHTSHLQHIFISRAIAICAAFIRDSKHTYNSQDLLHRLMPGVTHHLASTDIRVRTLGMALSQELVKILDPSGIQLDFEYEADDEIRDVLNLMTLPKVDDLDTATRLIGNITLDNSQAPAPADPETVPIPSDDDLLDSDDDLEPYDMSHDTRTPAHRAPYYIRDCMEGLICGDDKDRVEACLNASESLIRSQPHGLTDVAAEFTMILLHLSDNLSIPQFTQLRSSAMVSLAVFCPIQVSTYLTGEFYKRNYNTRQRLDILEVLAKASRELSSIDRPIDTLTSPKIEEIDEQPESWRDIVSRRIESKTRRFHSPRQPTPDPVPNRFAPVAGQFLFPLIVSYDSRQPHCDLLGEDSLLLCRLISTTGVIMHAATHTPISRHMASAMFDFLWVLRYHNDSSVKQAVLFSFAMTCLALTPAILFTHFTPQLTDSKQWLQDVVEKDTSDECKNLALQVLYMLDDYFRQVIAIAVSEPDHDSLVIMLSRLVSEMEKITSKST